MKRPAQTAMTSFCAAILMGCGAAEMSPSAMQPQSVIVAASNMAQRVGLQDTVPESTQDSNEAEVSESAPSTAKPSEGRRKIIYTTSMTLNVESFDTINADVLQLTEKHDGFVAGAHLAGTSGAQRSGTWTLRIPVDQYRSFLSSAGSLGEVLSRNEQTKEVTAEFYDVEARIRNKEAEEERLITLLKDRTGKLEDVLAVEKEITRVRGEVEQLRGRMRVLQDLTAFSTVTLCVYEVQNYTPAEAPNFGTKVSRTWQATVEDLSASGQALCLTAIRVGPWFVLVGIPIVLLALFVRKRLLNAGRTTTTSAGIQS